MDAARTAAEPLDRLLGQSAHSAAIDKTMSASGSTTIGNLETNTAISDLGPIDHSLSPPTSTTTTSTSKCMHSTMSAESSDQQGSLSQPASITMAMSSNLNLANKKQTLTRGGVSQPVSRRSEKLAADAAQAAAIMGMQGSINHLTNIFQESMHSPEDDRMLCLKHALKLLQDN